MTAYKPVIDFPRGVKVAFSDVSDGSIAAGGKPSTPEHEVNTEKFLASHGFGTTRAKVFVTYLPENTYTHVERVTGDNTSESIKSDALYTTDRNQVITLPVADCIATVVYDPAAGMLGVLHLGRHASVAGLIESFIIEVADAAGSDPRDWHVWMSPSLQAASNRLEYFNPPYVGEWHDFQTTDGDGTIHIDIPGHNKARFERAGVKADNIHVSTTDTYTDENYFSHRAATELDKPERQGRMMVAAVMTD